MHRISLTIDGAFVKEVPVDKDILVGRADGADLQIPNSEVSSRHARIRAAGEGVVITDLSSTNGTFLNGEKKIEPGVDVRLEPGTRVCIGPAVLEVLPPAEGKPAPRRETADAHKMFGTMVIGTEDTKIGIVSEAKFRSARPRIVVASESDRRTVPLEKHPVEIGREETDVVLSHPSVSGRHARISFENGYFVVRDHGSRNGTMVDGLPISGPAPLGIQSAVTFGTVECLFAQDPPEQGEGVEDVPPEVIVRHVVALGRATRHQGEQVLEEHASGGRSLGEIFVERGILPPREWIEIYRQRKIIGTLSPVAGRRGMHPVVWMALGLLLAALAAWGAWRLLFAPGEAAK